MSETRAFRALAAARSGCTPRVLVLTAAIPIVFLHVNYQPGVNVPVGSTQVGIQLSDAAVFAIALTALWEGRSSGFGALRAGIPLWLAAVLLLGWIFVRSESFKHAVTAAKFAEYALIAPSVPLLLRRRLDWELVAAVITIWCAIATSVGVLQFFGVDIAGAWAPGRRQPSFLGHTDFAALSALALGIGLTALVFAQRRLGWAPLASGALGLVLAGATAGLIGIAAGTAALLYAAWPRRVLRLRSAALCGGVVAVVAAGVLTLRAGDYDQFLRFLNIKRQNHAQRVGVETYAHHTLLAYIGYRIWRAHPVFGVGWQGSTEAQHVDPQLPAAHRKFPDVAPLAFPTRAHEWGVQDAYVQAAADLGVIGFVLWLAPFVLASLFALRSNEPLRGAIAAFAVIAAMGLWVGLGLVAGLPLDAVTWLGFGLAAAVAARPGASEKGERPACNRNFEDPVKNDAGQRAVW